MRLIGIADTHMNELYQSMLLTTLERERKKPGPREGDPTRLVLVAAGDIGNYLNEPSKFLAAIKKSGVPFLFVTGNHERESQARERLRQNPLAVWLDERVEVIEGVIFLGIGYTEAAPINRSRGAMIRPRLSALARGLGRLDDETRQKCPRVLVTHEPPRAFHKYGNLHIDRFAIRHGIRTIICGHIHVKDPVEIEKEHFRVISPGSIGMLVEVTR